MKTQLFSTYLSLFLVFSLATAPVQAATMPPAAPQPSTAEQTYDGLLTVGVIASLAALHYISAPPHVKEAFMKQLQPQALLCNLVTTYSSWFLAALAHEYGHALATKLLTGDECVIHLGTNDARAEPLIKLGPVHIDSLNPRLGVTENTTQHERIYNKITSSVGKNGSHEGLIEFCKSKEFKDFLASIQPDRRARAVILLAGSFAGILVHHCLQAVINPKHHRFLDSITMNQLLNAFVPNNTNDAALIGVECLNIPHTTLAKLNCVTQYAMLAGEVYCSINNPENTPDAPLHNAVVVGLLNFFLRGFLHFHA